MFAYLPDIYPDELVYSWLCRYHAHNGFPDVSGTFQDLLETLNYRISIEYAASFNSAVLEWISIHHGGIEKFCREHTMIDIETMFHPAEERSIHLSAVAHAHEPKLVKLCFGATGRYLRYCPICAKEDRSSYGETFWHRIHQVDDMLACGRHGCLLLNSTVRLFDKKFSELHPAEEKIPEKDSSTTSPAKLLDYSNFLETKIVHPVGSTNDNPISNFLRIKLPHRYLMTKEGLVDYGLLSKDLNKLTSKICKDNIPQTYIEHVIDGNYIDSRIILLMLFFFEFSPL